MDAVILRELSSALIAVSSPPTAPGWNHTLIARLSGDRPQRPAAVLVGLRQGRQPKLIFTVRTGDVATHVGEVAFPGGACDASDTDALATALRESGEEIGLDRRLVSPCGYLECFETLSGFCITPVVAWVNAQARLQPSPRRGSRNLRGASSVFSGARKYEALSCELSRRAL